MHNHSRTAPTPRRRAPQIADGFGNSRTIGQWIESLLVVVILTTFTNGFFSLFLRGRTAESASAESPAQQAIFVSIYVVIALLFLLQLRHVSLRRSRMFTYLLLVTLLPLISTLWSVSPPVTLRRGLALLFTTLFGIYLAVRFRPRQVLTLLGWAMFIVTISSITISVAAPDLGLESSWNHLGAWRGVFHQKNVLGRNMALSLITFLLLSREMPRHRLVLSALVVASAFTLVLSTSATAIVAMVGVLLVWAAMRIVRLSTPLIGLALILLITLGTGVGAWTLVNIDDVLAPLGREATLTGRIQLWEALIRELKAGSHIFGYGYGAFWGELPAPGAQVRAIIGWDAKGAHNGVLEILLQVGLFGLVFLTLYLGHFLKHALQWTRNSMSFIGPLSVVLVYYLLISSITQEAFLERNDIFWVLIVWLSMLTSKPASARTGSP